MTDAELDALDWDSLGRTLTAYARRMLGSRGSRQEAEDVAYRAVATLCRRVGKGELLDLPAERRAVLGWLTSTIRLQIKNDTRTKSKSLVGVFDSENGAENEDDDLPTPEEHLLLKRRSTAVRDAILDRVAADELAGDVFLLSLDGVDGAAAQAAHLRKPVSEIYKARRRLDGHYRQVVTELKDEVDHG